MKKAPIVHIEFLDHAQCSGDSVEPCKIDLYGVLVKEDKKGYTIACWVADNDLDHNSDCYYVVKHKGIKIRRLK